MTLQLTIFVCVVLFLCFKNVNCQEPLVEISQGTLRGKTLTNRDGGTIYSFQSIPYAQPPINELRFKAPVAAEGWEGIRDATTDLPSCWQFSTSLPIFEGQEDCLYLNVFTPELPSENSSQKPVMVFMYSVGFIFGSGQTSRAGPEFLLLEDVVLVTLNFRLGILGFLNLDDPDLEVPGNAGLKDQVMAFQWIRDNIGRFGGDPDSITIAGESSGGTSTHLHMLSPMSTGLFHKVIGQSGVSIKNSFQGAKNSGEIIAEQLGIQTDNWRDMLASLREVPADELTATARLISMRMNDEFTLPIIEEPSNEPAFIASQPVNIVRSGNYNQVPYMTGNTNSEGLLYQVISLLAIDENILIQDFTTFIPDEFEIAPGSEEEAAISQRIKEFYYGDTEPTRENITAAVALWGDYAFKFPAYRTLLEHLKTSSAPLYYYILSADTALNALQLLEPRIQDYPGAAHTDTLGYLLTSVYTPSVIEEGSVEDLALRQMVKLWTNFATYGNPTPDDSNGFVWLPVNETSFNFLNIDTTETYSDVDPTSPNMQFWYDLYQEFKPIDLDVLQ